MSRSATRAVGAVERAFIAIRPPHQVLTAVERVVEPLRDRWAWARWSDAQQWHLTVQFLGRVADPRRVTRALSATCLETQAFECQVGGAGAFPTPRRAGVVWLGLAAGSSELVSFAARVAAALAPLGFGVSEHELTPHLTVARSARPRSVAAVLAALGEGPVGPRWEVCAIGLYESHLATGRPRYRLLTEIPLGRTGILDGGA